MENIRPTENYTKKSPRKVIETINYNGRYVDVSTIRNKVISASIGLIVLVSIGIIIFL